MKHSLFLVLVISFIVGCNKSSTTYSDSKIYGLASPILLNSDTTRIFMSDYFMSPVLVDSIISDDETLQVNWVDDYIFLVSQDNSKLISNLTLYAEGIPYSFLVKDNRPKKQIYKISKTLISCNHLSIKGEFNNWQTDTFRQNKSHFLHLHHYKPGKYRYKLVADGKSIDDPNNPIKVNDGTGEFYNILEVKVPSKDESPRISTDSFTKTEIIISSVNVEHIYAYWNNFRIEAKKEGNSYKILIPPFAKYESRSHIRIFGSNDIAASNDLFIPLAKGKVISDPSKLNNNDWHSSNMYFIMLDRFVNDNAANDSQILSNAHYYGGDIKGITKMINDGYFRKLGINTIVISPITQNPIDDSRHTKDSKTKFSGNYGYWPITSTTIDYRLGTPDDIRKMLNTAHKNGLSVLLDYVANHVHEKHTVYKKNNDWATPRLLSDSTLNIKKWDSHRLTTWSDTFLPTLNLMDQEVTDFMVDSALTWVTKYDFDGFKHNATNHIPNNFWRTMNKKIKEISQKKKKHIYQFGETYGISNKNNTLTRSGLLDAQIDYSMYYATLSAFASDSSSFSLLAETLEFNLIKHGHHHLMGIIAGSQYQPGFIGYTGGSQDLNSNVTKLIPLDTKNDLQTSDSMEYKKLVMFNAFSMVIPGIPIIYYGDKIGISLNDTHTMKFANMNKYKSSLREEISNLLQTRNTNMALLYGDLTILEQTDSKLVMSRKYFNNHITVTFDKSNWSYSIKSK